jgi:serine phosphatase RsbU (regulator of sigma subunit)
VIRVLIVDDEAPARDRLRRLLDPAMVEVVGEAADGERALAQVEALLPDLVFLDIQMPLLSGLGAAARLAPPRPRIVFCTAYDEFAIAAFEQQALDYLLKPVSRDRLRRTVDRVVSEVDEQRRRTRDDAEASRTQVQLMPRGGAAMGALECRGECRPARVIGGDFFDFLRLDEDRLALAVADVSGKGEFAALLAAALQARLQTLAARHVHAPADLIRQLNRLTHGRMEENRFATIFVGVYSAADRALRYANAGHVPALIASADGTVRQLTPSGPAVGWTSEIDIGERVEALAAGDLVLICTDGISETPDPAGRELSMIDLARFAAAQRSQSTGDIVRAVFAHVEAFGRVEPADDRTVVVAKVK